MARRLPSLNALRAFEAAARHTSFTLAAAELNVSHAAISRHIRELEGWLGVELFVRTGRGVTPTSAGVQLGADLTPPFDALSAAVDRTAKPRGRQHLFVSVEASFAALWLASRIGRFTAAHPGIDLVLDPDNRLVDFRKDDVDLAIRYGCGGWPGVTASKLIDADLFPVCTKAFQERKHLRAIGDLQGADLLRDDPKQLWENWLDAAGARSVAASGPLLKGYLALSVAESGQGVALADAPLAIDSLKAGRLIVPFATSVRYGAYYLVRPDAGVETRAMKTFALWLRKEVRETSDAIRRFIPKTVA